jgi:hypothetical protein
MYDLQASRPNNLAAAQGAAAAWIHRRKMK